MKQKVRNYRDLVVWQKGIDLVKDVYQLTKQFPNHERYALANQLQRAAVSVPSNIAEGQARQHTKEFRQFLYISLGSLAEVDTQIVVAQELTYITAEEAHSLFQKITPLKKMLHSLINRLS